MNLFLIAFTDRGKALADTLAAAFGGEAMRCGEPLGLSEWTAAHFQTGNGLIFVGAAGIAVRAVAPYVRGKAADPAVVVVDEQGRFAIPVLSGHLGGANDLARAIGRVCGAVPVLTTATDLGGVFAVDEWAKRQNCAIPDIGKIKEISSWLLAGGTVRVRSDWPIAGEVPPGVYLTDEKDYNVLLSLCTRGKDVLRLVPRIAMLGVGCKRGTPRDALEAALTAMLGKSSLFEQAICAVATIDLKKDEPGLLAFCQARRWPLCTYSAEQLKGAEGGFTASAFVERVTGVENVCERAAVLGAPLGHDFCVISLSDLLTPWPVIEKRLRAAAEGDFCVCLYNPASHKRTEHLKAACGILMDAGKSPQTLCGWVRNIGRLGQESHTLTLGQLTEETLNMFTTVFIGNSNTVLKGGWLVTPRGYLKS